MNIAKFPVISATGQEFLVGITDEYTRYFESITVIVYEKIIRETKFLKKKREKLHKLSKKSYHKYDNDHEKYDYYICHFKQLAIDAVQQYEDWVYEHEKEKKLAKQNLEEFENWDGNCK